MIDFFTEVYLRTRKKIYDGAFVKFCLKCSILDVSQGVKYASGLWSYFCDILDRNILIFVRSWSFRRIKNFAFIFE